jgi:VWFA-related protein
MNKRTIVQPLDCKEFRMNFLSRGRPCFLVAGIIFLFTASIPGQSSQGNGTITSSSELVLVPAVITDKSGAHIAGMKKEDFLIKQDGKPQPIAIFEEVTTSSTRIHRSNGEQGTFSNLEPGASEYHRLSIIVLDLLNTPFVDQAGARAALLKFLNEAADSGEPMCLLALTSSGLSLLHDFTQDPKTLAAALNQAKVSSAAMNREAVTDPHHPTSGALAAIITFLIRSNMDSEAQLTSLQNKTAAAITVQALQQIAKAFRGLPGKKSLLWASSGFPFSLSPSSSPSSVLYTPDNPVHARDEMQTEYDNLWRLMNDAQIAIYSVDLRSPSSTFMATGGVRPSDTGDPQFDSDALARDQAEDTRNTLQAFAENTGGRAFLGGGNLIQAFQQAVHDDTRYYMLGYYVNRASAKPGWHQITLAIRAKGARARYRNGFFLNQDTTTATAKQNIQLALNSPFNYTGVPISVTWSGQEPSKASGKMKMSFDLVMPPEFASIDELDGNHVVVDIAVAARDATGNVLANLSQRIDVHLKTDGLEQIQHNGMTYRNGLQLPPGDYNVRFVVRDALGNRMGSVAAPVRVSR